MTQPESINSSVAFFISPTGETLFVPTSHIASVIKNPEAFGTSTASINKIYRHYNEPLGLEGNARYDLLIEIVLRGWIRLRRYPNQQWSITVDELVPSRKEYLRNWCIAILTGANGLKESDIHLPIVITQLRNSNKTTHSLSELITSWIT